MIVDTHTHWPVGTNDDTDAFLKALDRYGTDRAVVCGLEVLHKVGAVSACNDRLAAFCARSGGRLIPLATVHLAEGNAAVDEARRCLETLGMKGFKFHPWVQGENVFREPMDEICRLVAEFDVPLLFHDGTPVYALSSQVAVLAGRFPRTRFILGHTGLLYFWEEAMEAARQFENVYVTLCGPHLWAMQAICDGVDPRRIVWGTDYVGPGAEEYIAYRRGLFDRLHLSGELRDAILNDNPRRLFALDV